ncbi:unnamed protein product [Dovyalis caffra]|uniref:Bulb-type lectin domain-containing protein n=1 Tax=Dovyalis caffra TaxID=77055 RepID=A0AAV1RU07_9ROSI|nr:unnamed protein product [Dovyalis caffra]
MNRSTGKFRFTLQADGNLVLYTLTFPLDLDNSSYWSAQTEGNGFQLIFNQSGNIYLAAKNGIILKMLSSESPTTQEFYHIAFLEYDGVFRHYVYPKRSSSNFSGGLLNEDSGSGACRFNSYCSLGNDQRPNCKRPPGYNFLDPNDVMKG